MRQSIRVIAGFLAMAGLTATVVSPVDAQDTALGGPERVATAQPELGDVLARAVPPGARQLVAGIRIIDAWNARNRVYREAGGVQRDLRAHYGALAATAERLGAESGDTERYERVQQMLAEEQRVALSLTEDEKRDAKYGFESSLRRELTNALLQVPQVREGLDTLRRSLGEIRSTLDGVRTAIENGNPLSGVVAEANDRLAGLNRVAGFGELIGGRPGRQLASLTQRLNGLVDQLDAPNQRTTGDINGLLEQLDNVTARVDDQLDKGRWIRTGAALQELGGMALEEAIAQIEGRINGSGAGDSAFVSAISNAIVRERAGRDDLPPLAPAELQSMRDRVEAALLGRSTERIGSLCGRLAGEALRRGDPDVAPPACSIYGDPEELQRVLDAARSEDDGSATATTEPSSSDAPAPATTVRPRPTTTAAPVTTQPPPPPTVIAKIAVTETITDGTVDALSIEVEVVADLATGFVSVSSAGGGSRTATYTCDDGSTVIDEVVVRQQATAVGTGTGEVEVGGGSFQASFDITGSTVFSVEQGFTDARCTQFNADYSTESPYTGSGTISGTVSSDGAVTVRTNWSAGGARVTGAGSGAGELSGAG